MNIGVRQIQSQLVSLHMESKSLKIGKDSQPKVHAKVWCIKCKDKGHDKDHCLVYQNFLIGEGPIPLKPENIVGLSERVPLRCIIFQIDGKHANDHFHLLQKFVHTLQQFFFTLFKSVGNDERNY